MVASTAHDSVSCTWMRDTRASILKASPGLPEAISRIAAPSSAMASFIQSSDVWCTTMNISSSCASDRGRCSESRPSKRR